MRPITKNVLLIKDTSVWLTLKYSPSEINIDIYKKPRCPISYTKHVKIGSGS